jgi:hypothetical protein
MVMSLELQAQQQRGQVLSLLQHPMILSSITQVIGLVSNLQRIDLNPQIITISSIVIFPTPQEGNRSKIVKATITYKHFA